MHGNVHSGTDFAYAFDLISPIGQGRCAQVQSRDPGVFMRTVKERLFHLLASYQGDGVFNQYRDTHPDHDLPNAPQIRLDNLRHFLNTFPSVRYILLAEAAGYQGCRFSGIPMTSEVQIAGPNSVHWAKAGEYARSGSRDRLWREPSATILWETLGEQTGFLIWNTFPWHPMGKRGPLSNRTPRRREIPAGVEVLRCLMELYPGVPLVAIGRVAERTLTELGMEPLYVRHPAHGGKPQFVAGIQILNEGTS